MSVSEQIYDDKAIENLQQLLWSKMPHKTRSNLKQEWLMLIAKVVGSAVATIKEETLVGSKLMVIQEANAKGEAIGKPIVAIDTVVDAGVGELVLIASGSSARQTQETKDRPR